MFKLIIILPALLFLFNCGDGSTTENSEPLDASPPRNDVTILYPLKTNPELNYGTIRSVEADIINLNYNFNSWGTAELGYFGKEIKLKIKEEIIRGEYDPSAIWAFFVRTTNDTVGRLYADELEASLIFNYTRNDEICCVNTRPFRDFDQGDKSYIATSGFIDFESDKKASFDLVFQQETDIGSNDVVGPTINVVGCWRFGVEYETTGCSN